MKLLLTGKNGQVGFELRRALAVLGDVIGVDAGDCDLADEAAVRRLVRDVRPDIIVNPAAYTAVDKAESDSALAYAVNARAAAVMAEEADAVGAALVHYSTDYVFDGSKQAPYGETDTPRPINVYGATKLAGEQLIAANCSRHLILRTSWVVGAHGNNFAKTMLRLATERQSLNVVADQFGAPTSAALLADLTAHVLRQLKSDPSGFPYGLYHAVAGGQTSWYGYAKYVIERARRCGRPIQVQPDAIYPITTSAYPTPAMRPANSCLDTSLLCKTFNIYLPDWKIGVDHILDQIL